MHAYDILAILKRGFINWGTPIVWCCSYVLGDIYICGTAVMYWVWHCSYVLSDTNSMGLQLCIG